jgi:NhaA family Na+:H+ antiporter
VTDPASSLPPDASPRAHGAVRRLLAPVQAFLRIEAASGIVLVIAAVAALVWANSPYAASYHALWHTPVGVSFGDWSFERPLHFVVNDGLMTVFFFVVGLEIRREIHEGELATPRRAALPLAAALGGMLLPAAIYGALNAGRAGAAGWGIPMATDIAFAVGVLALLGSRVPGALRVLLLALAVIDDIGAILVIAVFYSAGLELVGLGIAAIGVAVVVLMKRLAVRSPWAYVVPGLGVWAGLYVMGVHPTLAGVLLGLLAPATAWYGAAGFAADVAPRVERARDLGRDELTQELDAISRARKEALAITDYLIHSLHGLVAFAIMPVFALANAGVSLEGASLAGDSLWVFVGIIAGLVVGKTAGIALACALATRTGLAIRPRDVGGHGLLLVGMVGGIGFTMSLFIAQLAFPPGALLETAKLAILIGSTAAGVLGLAFGRTTLRPARTGAGAPADEAAAERSTEA